MLHDFCVDDEVLCVSSFGDTTIMLPSGQADFPKSKKIL
nr:MAG TPA: hypothetical protein [Caudoviricetes sp.]